MLDLVDRIFVVHLGFDKNPRRNLIVAARGRTKKSIFLARQKKGRLTGSLDRLAQMRKLNPLDDIYKETSCGMEW